MAPQKSPAFSFYAKDFLTGTSTMSLQEVGAYMRLLAYSWDAGSVPADPSERARILVCAKAQERELWKKVGKKFLLRDDVYVNERLEEERQKQIFRRQRLSDNGRMGGRPQKANEKLDESKSFPETKANEKQLKSLSSSSSFSSTQEESRSSTTKDRSGALIVGGGEYFRLLETHAFVGSVLRVPKKLHAELCLKSGANADAKLQAWYESLNIQLEESGKGTGDVFEFLRPRHQAYALAQGWIDPAPKVNGAEKKPFSVAEALAKREAEKAGKAS